MAGRWLFKEEPTHYGFDELVRDRKTMWDGVRNNLALKHLRSVKKGDLFLYYHTGKEKQVVGVGKALSDAYPNPEADDPRLAVVDVAPVKRLPNPVTLADIKANPKFADFALVRISRLSVMPVTAAQWKEIERMAR
jgi:predicted RNA-binding protein with PUA-like domain